MLSGICPRWIEAPTIGGAGGQIYLGTEAFIVKSIVPSQDKPYDERQAGFIDLGGKT